MRMISAECDACIVGCSDGKFLIPFARKHYKVSGYDIDEVALYGGYEQFPIINQKLNIVTIKILLPKVRTGNKNGTGYYRTT